MLLALALLSCSLLGHHVATALPVYEGQTAQLNRRHSNTTTFNKNDFKVPTDFPGVSFKIPESYAGLLPLYGEDDSGGNETAQLFFWYYPHTADVGQDDLVIWLNGGPGCSSLGGAFNENGPWLLNEDYEARENPYSWTNLGNVVYIEQPVGTGFSTGTPTAKDQTDSAGQFVNFLKTFYTTFPDLQNKKLWVTGESYAGMYVPYIAAAIYEEADSLKSEFGIDLRGIHIIDPAFTTTVPGGFGQDLVAMDYAEKFQAELQLNDTVVGELAQLAEQNGIYNFTARNLQYPPEGPILTPPEYNTSFSFWGGLFYFVDLARECLDVYDISQDCPLPRDPLGYSGVTGRSDPDNWITQTPGVFEALNVGNADGWLDCVNATTNPVYVGDGPGGDESPPPDRTVLPSVIEKSERSIIAHGDWDFRIIREGSQLAIQNMTWGGQQGFQEQPKAALKVDGKPVGTVHTERGLTFATVTDAGHMLPADAPAAAFKLMQYLLGQIDSLEG